MTNFKKLALLCTSLLLTLGLGVATACGDSEDSSDAISSVETTSSEAPAESSEAPAESSETPVESSETPVESSETPVESSEAPEESSEAPAESSEAPEESSEESEDSSETPVESSEAPEESSEESEESSEEPTPSVNTNPNVLALGENAWTGVSYDGNETVFTATEAGAYALSSSSADASFYDANWDAIEFPYSFELEAGETFTLHVCASKYGKTVDVVATLKKATPAPTEAIDLTVGDNEITLEAGETVALKATFDHQAYGPLTAPAGIRIGDWNALTASVVADATNEYIVKLTGSTGGEVIVYATAEEAGTYAFNLKNYVAPVSTTEMEGEFTVPTAFGFSLPVTFTIAEPGNYLVESWEDPEYTSIKNSVWGMGGNTYSFKTTEANEQITLYFSNGNIEEETALVDYVINQVLPVSLTQAGGTLEITANADVVVEFTADVAGTYVIGSTNETLSGWFDEDVDHSMLYMYPLIAVVTDPAVPVKFNVHIDDMNYVTVKVPFTVAMPKDIEITAQTYTDLEVVANVENKVIFTAPTAGYYKVEIETASTYFGMWDTTLDPEGINWEYSDYYTFYASAENEEVVLYLKTSFQTVTFTVSVCTDEDLYPSEYELRIDEDGNSMTQAVVIKANGSTTINIFGRGSYELSWSAGYDVTVSYNDTVIEGSSILFGGNGSAFTVTNNEDEDLTINFTLTIASIYYADVDVFVGAMGANVTANAQPYSAHTLTWSDENLTVTVMNVSGEEPVEVPVSGMSVTLEANTKYEITFGSTNGQQLTATVHYQPVQQS